MWKFPCAKYTCTQSLYRFQIWISLVLPGNADFIVFIKVVWPSVSKLLTKEKIMILSMALQDFKRLTPPISPPSERHGNSVGPGCLLKHLKGSNKSYFGRDLGIWEIGEEIWKEKKLLVRKKHRSVSKCHTSDSIRAGVRPLNIIILKFQKPAVLKNVSKTIKITNLKWM